MKNRLLFFLINSMFLVIFSTIIFPSELNYRFYLKNNYYKISNLINVELMSPLTFNLGKGINKIKLNSAIYNTDLETKSYCLGLDEETFPLSLEFEFAYFSDNSLSAFSALDPNILG